MSEKNGVHQGGNHWGAGQGRIAHLKFYSLVTASGQEELREKLKCRKETKTWVYGVPYIFGRKTSIEL